MDKGKTLFIGVLWILGLAWMSMDVSGQAPPDASPSSLPPGVHADVAATPGTATIGDPIRIDLSVTMPAGYRFDVSKPESQIGDFTLLDFFPGPMPPNSGNTGKIATPSSTQVGASQRLQAQIIVAAYKTGTLLFPSIRMKGYTAEGKEFAFNSPPVPIEIRSVLNDKNQNLIDLKKQAEIPERRPWMMWGIMAAAILMLGAIIWFFLKRRRRRPVPLSPAQVQNLIDLAEVDLRNLLARGLPESGSEKQFYVLLSEIVKRILEAGHEIHTAEQTTSEIMASLSNKSELDSGKTELIESFLLRCDVVKFAKYIPSRIEHEEASKDALQILVEARKAAGSRQCAVGSECKK
jgi:hypothetical protein